MGAGMNSAQNGVSHDASRPVTPIHNTVENVKKNIAVFHYDMTLDKGFVDDMTTKVTIAAEVGIVKEPINWKTQWMSKFARTVDPALVAVQP